jgi:signal transduction histidine kinase
VARWLPRGVAARSALAAMVVSAALFVGGALWLRHVVYTQQLAATEQLAIEYVDTVLTESGNLQRRIPGPGLSYEVVAEDGRVLDTSPDLVPFQDSGPVTPVPRSAGGEYTLGIQQLRAVVITTPPGHRPSRNDLAGRTVPVVSATGFGAEYGTPGLVRVSVLVSPFEAEAAVASVDGVLWRAVPPAVLLVAAVAWLATTRALRPVERIRARAAEISARDLHQRVPVPKSRDAVARLATTLNATLGRLEQAVTRQRGFVADAAHELRSPIASVRTQLEVALDQPDRADWPAVAEGAVTDVERLQSLAEDLLLLARFDAEVAVPFEEVDLAALAREYCDSAGVACRAAGPAPMRGHAGHLRRLLGNLVDNARRHAAATVQVSVDRHEDGVVVEVIDDGPGIPAADRERAFERFTRLDEARTRDDGGAGLGLAIARDIAVRHGGTLTVGDSPAGARLVATFPRGQRMGNATSHTSSAGPADGKPGE